MFSFAPVANDAPFVFGAENPMSVMWTHLTTVHISTAAADCCVTMIFLNLFIIIFFF